MLLLMGHLLSSVQWAFVFLWPTVKGSPRYSTRENQSESMVNVAPLRWFQVKVLKEVELVKIKLERG